MARVGQPEREAPCRRWAGLRRGPASGDRSEARSWNGPELRHPEGVGAARAGCRARARRARRGWSRGSQRARAAGRTGPSLAEPARRVAGRRRRLAPRLRGPRRTREPRGAPSSSGRAARVAAAWCRRSGFRTWRGRPASRRGREGRSVLLVSAALARAERERPPRGPGASLRAARRGTSPAAGPRRAWLQAPMMREGAWTAGARCRRRTVARRREVSPGARGRARRPRRRAPGRSVGQERGGAGAPAERWWHQAPRPLECGVRWTWGEPRPARVEGSSRCAVAGGRIPPGGPRPGRLRASARPSSVHREAVAERSRTRQERSWRSSTEARRASCRSEPEMAHGPALRALAPFSRGAARESSAASVRSRRPGARARPERGLGPE